MNKKGEEEDLLMSETINLIVALLCIAALIGLIVLVYFALTTNQNTRYALESVNGKNGIANETKRINADGVNNSNFFVPNPSGWFIFSFVGEDIKPNKCAGANCICICEGVTLNILDWQKRQLNKCDDKGSCAVISNLKKFDKIKINGGGVFVSIKKVNDLIEITKND